MNRSFLVPRLFALAAVAAAVLAGCQSQVISNERVTVRSGLGALDVPRDFRAARVSSNDATGGNADMHPIQPGQTLTLAELRGPGRIAHIWFTVAHASQSYPGEMVLRIYWDGRQIPSVEAPLGDFFAVGHGLRADVDSAPVAVSSRGRAYNCYWPMPFAESARITVTNESDRPCMAFYYNINWQQLDRLEPGTPYFHAQYHQSHPAIDGRNHLVLDAQGSGHYVGTVMNVRNAQPSWFGEGDDFFWIDGAQEPQLMGTGTEDYFSDAWGFRAFNRDYHGVTVWEGMRAGDRGTAYRWHVNDPIPFQRSLRFEIETRGGVVDPDTGAMTDGFGHRGDEVSTVAYWYQTGIAKPFALMPELASRMPPRTVIEAEDAFDQLTPLNATLARQDAFSWSGGAQVLVMARGVGGGISYSIRAPEPGRYSLGAVVSHSFDYGIYQAYLDGRPIGGPVDLYDPELVVQEFNFGPVDLAGTHRFELKCVGANPMSRIPATGNPGYYLGLDAILLTRLPVDPR